MDINEFIKRTRNATNLLTMLGFNDAILAQADMDAPRLRSLLYEADELIQEEIRKMNRLCEETSYGNENDTQSRDFLKDCLDGKHKGDVLKWNDIPNGVREKIVASVKTGEVNTADKWIEAVLNAVHDFENAYGIGRISL